jgi:hypothetical protein
MMMDKLEQVSKQLEKNNKTLLSEKYDYKSLYIRCNLCNKQFYKTADKLKSSKYRCPYCESSNKPLDTNSFIEKAKHVHGDKFSYDKTIYTKSTNKVTITCRTHGDFEQVASKHLIGQDCIKCSYEDKQKDNASSIEEFISKASKLHQDLYDYKDVVYVNNKTKVTIICKKCKEHFEQRPDSHLIGKGCPKCLFLGTSNQEKELIDFINSVYNGKILSNTREIISPKELDIYLPDNKFAIEYNGLFWHKEDLLSKDYHYQKTTQCEKKGIRLFHIFSDEWIEKKDIIKSMICSRLNISKHVIFARKCEFKQVSAIEAKYFYESNHIAGGDYYKYNFGLYYKDILVSCIGFRKPRHTKKYSSHIEIARFANAINHNIPGAFQKLLNNSINFIKNKEKFNKILSYCDLRFGNGEVYKISGFKDCGYTGVDYWYTDGKIRVNRLNFITDSLKKQSCKSEDIGMFKIYGCGSKVYIKDVL